MNTIEPQVLAFAEAHHRFFPPPDLYDAIAVQIERENTLVNHRLTWTLQLNGFLFTAIGMLGSRLLADPLLHKLVHLLIPLTGLSVSVAGVLGVLAAQSQIAYLTAQWETKLSGSDPRPRPFGSRRGSHLLGLIPCLLPPAVLAFVWLYFLGQGQAVR